MLHGSTLVIALLATTTSASAASPVREGAAALGDWRSDAPGVVRHVTAADLPAPFATPPAGAPSSVVARPSGAALKTLPGFTVQPFAKLEGPRQIRVAPNGDIFVAETDAGRITVLRAVDGAASPAKRDAFAEGLDRPFGIAFYPAGPNPQWVYVANNNSVVRFAYRPGDLKARGAAQTVVAKLADTTGQELDRGLAAQQVGALVQPEQPEGGGLARLLGREAPAVVAHDEREDPVLFREAHLHMRRRGVFRDVGEGLLQHPEDGGGVRIGKVLEPGPDRELARDSGAPGEILHEPVGGGGEPQVVEHQGTQVRRDAARTRWLVPRNGKSSRKHSAF